MEQNNLAQYYTQQSCFHLLFFAPYITAEAQSRNKTCHFSLQLNVQYRGSAYERFMLYHAQTVFMLFNSI